jgi:D-cysteine desulfhydrase family pyridoxal phosphate-dependent enzyme
MPLICSPTPLHPAENLSRELGINLWLKRDDLTGPGAFGGNKMRKLEFLMGEAKAMGAEYVFTYGASQSNHAMQTAAACARSGMQCVLYLVALVPPDLENLRGNILLDVLFGAEIHIVKLAEGESEDDGLNKCYALGEEQIRKLEEEGHRCLNIPMGGASVSGSLGYASGSLEMREQVQALGLPPFDCIYHATGSAGTMAGLLAGRAIAGGTEAIRGICASVKLGDYEGKALRLTNEVLARLGRSERVDESALSVWREYVGPAYEVPYPESTEAIKMMARREGITLDPVYSGKAFAGLLDHVKNGKIKPGQHVLFWCTGGAASLFAEPEIVGDFDD